MKLEELAIDVTIPRTEHCRENISSGKKFEARGQREKMYIWEVKWGEQSWSKTESQENFKVR